MEADLSTVVSSASSCNPNATVVMNTGVFGPVFSLTSLTEENDKSDFCPDKFGTPLNGLIPDGSRVIVETSRGLVQLVTDSISVGQVTLNNINTSNQATLNGLPNNAHLQHTTLLSQGDTFSHTGAPLFEVQTETVADPSELHLSSPMVISHTPAPGTNSLIPTPTEGMEDERKLQKRKGGWPKGKKRKKEKESNAPKAPATAYVLFAIERRASIKDTNPELPFVEVTKILGSEWSAMTTGERQKYIHAAEADKKRYMEQLKDYQHSDAYLNFLKRKKLKGICNEEETTTVDGQYIDSATFLNELEEEGLYCKVCNQYFSSLHNRKEHMFGKQHLQAITSEFEKELQQDEEAVVDGDPVATSDLSPDVLTSESDQSMAGNSFGALGASGPSPVDITGFIDQFLSKNCDREQEIRALRQTVEVLKERNVDLVTKYQQIKEIETKVEQDVGNLKAYQAALIAQIDGLRMVPTLFGVINFYISGKPEDEEDS